MSLCATKSAVLNAARMGYHLRNGIRKTTDYGILWAIYAGEISSLGSEVWAGFEGAESRTARIIKKGAHADCRVGSGHPGDAFERVIETLSRAGQKGTSPKAMAYPREIN